MPDFVKKIPYILLALIVSNFSFVVSAKAQSNPASENSPVSATVPSFNIGDTSPPSVPILIYPENNSTISDPRPTYTFTRSTDQSTITYNLYINNVLTFTTIPDNANKLTTNYSSLSTTDEIQVTPLYDLEEGTYTWFVTATDEAGNTSTSSTFTFSLDSAPTPPILIYPANDSYISDPTPTYTFKRSTDSSSITYDVYIDGVLVYSDIPDTLNKLSGNYSSQVFGDTIQLTPFNTLIDGRHSWRVVATDLSGNSITSATFYFTIDTTPPPITVTKINGHNDLYLSTKDPDSIGPDTKFEVTNESHKLEITTEPLSTVTITLTRFSETFTYTKIADSNGFVEFDIEFELGQYLVLVSAIDLAGNTSSLEVFTIEVIDAVPGFLKLPFATASLSEIRQSRLYSAAKALGMIAFVSLILLLLLKKRYNIYVYDLINEEELENVKVFHSIPDRELDSTTTDKRGRARILYIDKGSTLTFKHEDKELVFSVLRPIRKYIVKL